MKTMIHGCMWSGSTAVLQQEGPNSNLSWISMNGFSPGTMDFLPQSKKMFHGLIGNPKLSLRTECRYFVCVYPKWTGTLSRIYSALALKYLQKAPATPGPCTGQSRSRKWTTILLEKYAKYT